MFVEEIISVLQAANVGTPMVDIFASTHAQLPDENDAVTTFMTIVETPGLTAQRSHNSLPMQRPMAQLVARSTSYAAAREMAYKAYYALFAVKNQRILGTWYQEIEPQQEPFDLDLDQNQRVRVAFNIRATKKPSL